MEEIGLDRAQISPQNGYNNVPAFMLSRRWEAGARVLSRTFDDFFLRHASTEGVLEGRLWATQTCQQVTAAVVKAICATQMKEDSMTISSRTIRDGERYTMGLTYTKRCLVHNDWASWDKGVGARNFQIEMLVYIADMESKQKTTSETPEKTRVLAKTQSMDIIKAAASAQKESNTSKREKTAKKPQKNHERSRLHGCQT